MPVSAWDVFAGRTAEPKASTWDNPAESYNEAKKTLANEDDRPLAIKVLGKLPLPKELNDRLNVKPWDKQKRYWNESVFDTRQDIIKDYMVQTGATFEEAMKWANLHDQKHKTTPITNLLEKYAIKKIFERDGIKRIN